MKIFLAGGTGFVGGHVKYALLEKGHEITLLTHRRAAGAEDGITTVKGDVSHPEIYGAAMQGCDAVINLVGIIREFPDKQVTFSKLHLQATRNLVDNAQKAGVKRFLQMSALGARPDAVSGYHKSKFQAEEYIRASTLDHTIFRPSIIFGPKDEFVNKLAGFMRKYPAVPVIGSGTYRLQPVAADDVARCFAMALEMPATIGNAYELCGPDQLTYNEMLDIIGKALGKSSVTKLKSPLGLMKLAAGFMQGFRFFPVTMDQIQMLLEENICSSGWPETFGIEPIRFSEGIRSYVGRY
jgi:uncharacterized protein YbjT (DUF2867 family)